MNAFAVMPLVARAAQALRRGDLDDAVASAQAVLGQSPDEPGALTVLALAHVARGDAIAAVPCLARLTVLAPREASHWANLATALREVGRHADAAHAADRALALRPGDSSLLFNRALLHLDLGEAREARDMLQAAHTRAPGDAEIRVQLARALLESGAERDARDLLRDVPDDAPLSPATLLALAGCCTQLGLATRAGAALARAQAVLPDDPDVHAQLALHAERLNRLDEAAAHLARAQRAGGTSVDRLAATARLAWRRGWFADARDGYAAAVDAAPNETLRIPHLFELARVCDKLGDVDDAVAALQRAHAARAAQWHRDDPAAMQREPELMTILRDRVDAGAVAAWPALARDPLPAPVFVVGFPRSGTTLLEQMLDAHPSLRAMDERPFLQYLISRCFRRGLDYPRDLGRIDDALATELRASYRASASDVVQLADGETLVDKNPLNLARLPMIARLWPDARVIVALRDPRDVVLSCFMQHFRNPGIARLTASLADGARAYAAMFDAFEAQAPHLPLRVLRLRYEDLAADPAAGTRAVCAFLGLDTHDGMAQPHAHAQSRGFISTPSYAQVVEPVHTRAIGRWHRYRAHFGDALDVLAPHVDRYGYARA